MTFSTDNFRRAIADYDRSWRQTDEALYDLCHRYSDHSDPGGVNAKLWIIGRTYATGIERKIPTDGKQGGSLSRLASHILKNARQVDGLFDQLRPLCEPLDPETLFTILDLHGQFIALISPIVRENQSTRSFASKYMHFHCPLVPIFDTYADAACRKLVPWQKSLRLFTPPKHADEDYARYVFRFFRLHEMAVALGLKPTSKQLDYYLLFKGGAIA